MEVFSEQFSCVEGCSFFYLQANCFRNFSSSFDNLFGTVIWGIITKSHFLLNIHLSPNHFPETRIFSQICKPFPIFTFKSPSGCGTTTSHHNTASNRLTSAFTKISSHSLSQWSLCLTRIFTYISQGHPHKIPSFPLQAYLILLPDLIPDGTLRVIFVSSCTRPKLSTFEPFL